LADVLMTVKEKSRLHATVFMGDAAEGLEADLSPQNLADLLEYIQKAEK